MLEQVERLLEEQFPQFKLQASEDQLGRGIVCLNGDVDRWETLVKIGQAVAKVDGVRNVVSDMTVKGEKIPKKDYTPLVKQGEKIGVIDQADVVIIGLGITGCAVARELSKYQLSIIALDMGEDVATAATKANNGGVHSAGEVKPGTLKAKMSVRGNRLYDSWAEQLGFKLIRPGVMKIADDARSADQLYEIFETAVENHDYRPALIDGAQAKEIDPSIEKNGEHPAVAVWMPSQGKVHPYEVAVALIENAAINGVKVRFNCTVGAVMVENGAVTGVITQQGIIKARYIVNAAGVYADEISEMAGDRCYTIHPRKGTIAIIDKNKPPMYERLVLKFDPTLKGRKNAESKGGCTDFTPSRNILLGPSATEVPDKEDTSTSQSDLDYIMSRNDNPKVTRGDIIRLYAGVRPADFKEDYVIEMSPVTHGFINAGAIQSPGIGAAPAVAELVEQILKADMDQQGVALLPKPDYQPCNQKKVKFQELSREQQDELIQKKPEYGRVICRCETITEGEILDAIHSPVVPTSIDAIKRRTRAGMGRCQGGFCQVRVLELLARELGKDWVEINLKGPGTNVLKSENRKRSV